jgi:drug/metabolite transporter (DMT)-like permease
MAACALLWSTAGLFIKLVDWNPFAIASARSVFAGLFLLAVIRKPKLTFAPAQLAAALSSAATMLLFVFANKETTSANAILLQYGSPVYVAFLGIALLGERPRAEHWVAFAAVGGGMALFFLDELGSGSLIGNLAAIGSGVTLALYFVFMRKQKEGSPLESALLAHAVAAPLAFALSFTMEAPRVDIASVGIVAVLGVFQIGLAAVFFAYGIKRVTAVEGVLVAVLEPIFNPVWVFLATGELPGPNAILGGLVIVAAVSASSLVSLRRDAVQARAAQVEGGNAC